MLPIVNAPHSVLSEKSKPIKKIDSGIIKLISDMKDTLLSAKDPIGVGLAAPQVGKSLQLFITKPTQNSPFTVFINPKMKILKEAIIKKKTKKSGNKLEGCLSLPLIWGEVERGPIVEVSYQDESGKEKNKIFKGFMAVIIQHEMDHLNGVLFPKRVLEQKGKLYKSEKDEKGQEIFNEINI